VIDVLSFTTCVSVATALGAVVRPADPDAALPALAPGDLLAGPRDGPPPTLSPASLRGLGQGQRLILPSPNGAAIATALDGTTTVAAALRNASAVAEWLGECGGRIGVVAAGEHDPDGRWRPSYEDAVGAGALVVRLAGRRTPQTEAAALAFRDATPHLVQRLLGSRSGTELADAGFGDDVAIAAELDADPSVPLLRDGAFTAVR
jgi:2-phosphosulfolactate phosphatase